jgi:hypothetical protein
MTTSLLYSQLKHSCFLSILIRRSVYQTQASLRGFLITFVNTFRFNIVVMFVCFTFASSVINLIIRSNLFYYTLTLQKVTHTDEQQLIERHPVRQSEKNLT